MLSSLKNRFVALLRSTERYTRIDMVYLFKGGALLSGADALLAVASLGLSILIATYVPKETFGIYRYVLSIANLLVIFSLTGMNDAITRTVALGREGGFVRSLPLQARFALLQVAAGGAVAAYYFIQGNAMYGWAFVIVALLAPVSGVANTYVAYLNGKKDFFRLASWRVTTGIVNVTALAAVVIASPAVIWLTLAYFLSHALLNAWFLFRTLRLYRPQGAFLQEDLAYGKHLSLMNAANIAASQLDSILIYHFLGPVALAVYTFAVLIPDRLRASVNFLSSVTLPRLARRTGRELRATARQRALLAFAIAAAGATAYALVAPFFFRFFFPQYLEAVPYTMLAGFVLAVAAPAKYLATVLTAEGSTRAQYWVAFSTPVLKIVLTVSCIPFIGIWGAILARIGATVWSGAVSYLFIARYPAKEPDEPRS